MCPLDQFLPASLFSIKISLNILMRYYQQNRERLSLMRVKTAVTTRQ